MALVVWLAAVSWPLLLLAYLSPDALWVLDTVRLFSGLSRTVSGGVPARGADGLAAFPALSLRANTAMAVMDATRAAAEAAATTPASEEEWDARTTFARPDLREAASVSRSCWGGLSDDVDTICKTFGVTASPDGFGIPCIFDEMSPVQ